MGIIIDPDLTKEEVQSLLSEWIFKHHISIDEFCYVTAPKEFIQKYGLTSGLEDVLQFVGKKSMNFSVFNHPCLRMKGRIQSIFELHKDMIDWVSSKRKGSIIYLKKSKDSIKNKDLVDYAKSKRCIIFELTLDHGCN